MSVTPQQGAFSFKPLTSEPAQPSRRNVVIEAGAGTGKTTAIVGEVLELMLENEELAPERIVLVTFTEKAAGEIADRIREALVELNETQSEVWPVGSPNPLLTITAAQRGAIAKQLARIDSLRSQTIHSFCQSLLRSFPIEAGLDPQFKIIEGFERSLLYGQLYDAWLDQETRVIADPAALAEWEFLFEHVGYLFQIRDLVFALLDRRDLLHETAYSLGEFAEVEPSLRGAVETLRRGNASEFKDENLQRIVEYVRAECHPSRSEGSPSHVRSASESGDPSTTLGMTLLAAWIAYLAPIAPHIREANLPRDAEMKEALKILRAGDKGRSMYDRLVSHRGALALLALTRRFTAFLDAEKRKLGVVDFDDLLLRTVDVLGDAVVLERARAQFDYIFVDEFQDTDRTQAKIIDLLARDRSGALVPGKTIVVGDPKQSIYGFRRADPETYYRVTEELVGEGAERRVIVDQYRSDPPLLDAINAIFGCLFPSAVTHNPNVFRPAYHALRAGKREPARTCDARITLLHASHEERADQYFSEAAAIAEWIKRGEGDLKRYAILFRRLTKIDDYLDTFDRYGIEYVLPPTRMFLDRRAPVDLLAVLRAIAYPFDRGAEISAARTPYFALTDAEIVGGFGDAFRASLDAFRAAAAHLTVSQLIDLVVDTCGIEAVYAAAADGVRHLRHLEHVRAIAFEYDQKQGGSIRQFVDEIERRRGEPDELEPSLADESKNAVRILSVHAAKGLEFDTVILPDLAFTTTGADAVSLFTVEEPRSLVMSGRAESISGNFRFASGEKLKKIAGQRDEAEMYRLFYVAVTRAKCELAFVCNLGEDAKTVGFLRCLFEALGTNKSELPGLWPDSGREVKPVAINGTVVPIAFERLEIGAAGERQRRRLRDASLEQQLATGEIVELTIDAPPPVAALSSADIAKSRSGSRNRVSGILLHRVLEVWDLQSEVEPLLRRLAAESACDAETVTRVRRYLAVAQRSAMLARIRAATTIGRELPVFSERATRIDRLIEENGALTVIDYKSGSPDETRLERNREQVASYCAHITAITGRECAGLLWYIDESGDQVVRVTPSEVEGPSPHER